MGAWDGDWARRIADFARREGYAHIWEYLLAHPGVPLNKVADAIEDAAAIQIHELIVDHCLANRTMGQLIRDLMARSIREELPKGWGKGTDFKHAQATSVGILQEPYAAFVLEMSLWLLQKEPPPRGWLPESGDDEVLRRAYDRAFESISRERRTTIERGEIEPQPGDAYWAKIEPIWKAISIYDGARVFREQFKCVRPEIGHLFAAHWCQSEIRNGGFHQFFKNPTGVLAPEAAAGFRAIGMPQCSSLVTEAMRFFGTPYPRADADRQAALSAVPGESRGEWDPFTKMDDQFYELIGTEAGGFAVAADRYSAAIHGSPWVEG